MKKFTLTFWVIIILISCSSDEPNTIAETILEISDSEIIISSEGDTLDFYIESNEVWDITEIPSWLTIGMKEGKGNQKVKIEAASNSKEEERFATLIIIAKEKSKELKIRQIAKNVILSLSESEIEFSAEPTTEVQNVDIITNEKWTITDIPDWCILSSDNGEGNTTITVTAEKNYVDTERNETILIKAGSKVQELKIKQKALKIQLMFSSIGFNSWYISQDRVFDYYSEASTRTVYIKSNTKWKIKSKSNLTWAQPNKVDGYENDFVDIDVKENTLKESRDTEFEISAGSKFLILRVRQGGIIEVLSDTPYQINQRDNAPRLGDVLIKRQVNYVDPGSKGENVSWNFSELISINDKYQLRYDEAPYVNGQYILGKNKFNLSEISPNSLIVRTEHNTMYYFQIKDDLLRATGHENATTILTYNPKMISDKYPTYYKDTYKYDYEAQSMYSGRIPGATKGYLQMEADAYGTITLPSGTYKDAIRIKYIQTSISLSVPGGGILIDPEGNATEYTIYKWYVKGYRYPVFETHRIIKVLSGVENFSTAFYFSPEDQNQMRQLNSVVEMNDRLSINKGGLWETVFPILYLNKY